MSGFRVYFFAWVFLAQLACKEDKKPNRREPVSSSSLAEKPKQEVQDTLAKKPLFYVQDASQYAAEWLQDFKQFHKQYDIRLRGDSVLVGTPPSDILSRRLPSNLETGRPYTFQYLSADTSYILILKRVNFSSLRYKFVGQHHPVEGLAHVLPHFLMASGLYVQKNGLGNGLHEYYDKSQEGCETHIGLGMGKPRDAFFTHFCSKDSIKIKTPMLSILE